MAASCCDKIVDGRQNVGGREQNSRKPSFLEASQLGYREKRVVQIRRPGFPSAQ